MLAALLEIGRIGDARQAGKAASGPIEACDLIGHPAIYVFVYTRSSTTVEAIP